LIKARRTIVLAGYDPKTIYKYFRKQGAQIGEGCSISVKTLGTEPYLIRIGNHVGISRDVVFHTHDGGAWVLQNKHGSVIVYGPIIIEDNCLIGVNVQLLPNIRIGRNSIVGANSVVISDIPPYSIVMGVPARPISSFAKYEERTLARWKEQSPPGVDTSVKNWMQMPGNEKKFRKHITNLYVNPEKTQEKNKENKSS
jgi:acetyltransferase-like isoleucine patch superfamily enzyme